MNKKRFSFFILIIIALILITGCSYDDGFPEASQEFYVYDQANIIDQEVKDYIIKTNRYFYEKEGSQIVVATINSLGNMDKNTYATGLFKKWEIGSREFDNGMLILIALDDGEIWIESGYGLEGPFPDSSLKRIIDEDMLTYFKENRYSDGILSGFNKIVAGLENEYSINYDEKKDIKDPIIIKEDLVSENSGFSESPITKFLVIIAIIVFFIIDFTLFGGRLTYIMIRTMGRGGRGTGGGSGGSSGGGGRSGGGGAGGSW